MTDRKSLAIILGVAAGVAAVATVAVYATCHREPAAPDINDVFEQARDTVRKLDQAVELLRKSVG